MLLERNHLHQAIFAPICDEDGQSPLSIAVQFGHEETVEILLERDDLSYDIADKQGRTPLAWAVALGHLKLIFLLERNRRYHEKSH